MLWEWYLSDSNSKTASISGNHKTNILTQLANGNRIILKDLGGWTPHNITINSCRLWIDDKIYIWLTNDERRTLLRKIAAEPGG